MRSLPALSRSAARGPLFALSTAVSLLVALLCALLPTGLPSSSNLGSAFSPSTAAVSLRAPNQTRIIAERLKTDSDTGKVVPPAQIIVGESIALSPLAPAPLAFAPAPAPFPERAAGHPAAWPRAPPSA